MSHGLVRSHLVAVLVQQTVVDLKTSLIMKILMMQVSWREEGKPVLQPS